MVFLLKNLKNDFTCNHCTLYILEFVHSLVAYTKTLEIQRETDNSNL